MRQTSAARQYRNRHGNDRWREQGALPELQLHPLQDGARRAPGFALEAAFEGGAAAGEVAGRLIAAFEPSPSRGGLGGDGSFPPERRLPRASQRRVAPGESVSPLPSGE